MIINGTEINIDFTDADIIEKIDEANEEVKNKIKKLEENITNIKPAEGIRQECMILKEFLDYVFGEGTSKEIFGEKNSLKECLKAFEDIINERNKQFDNLQNVIDKYSPDRLQK